MPYTTGTHPEGFGGGATHRQVFMGGATKAIWRRPFEPHVQKHDCAPECDTVRLSVCDGPVLLPSGVCWVLWDWSVPLVVFGGHQSPFIVSHLVFFMTVCNLWL